MKTLLKKTLAMLLVVCTVVSLCPMVLADDGLAAPVEMPVEAPVEEAAETPAPEAPIEEPEAEATAEVPAEAPEEDSMEAPVAEPEAEEVPEGEEEPEEELLAETATSGTCGASLTWAVANNVLTISGTGKMTAYKTASEQPWYQSGKYITSIVVQEGVTSIGECAFKDFSKVTSVTLPETLGFIGEYSFSGCSALKEIKLPEAVHSLGNGAFENCSSLTYVNIPNGVTDLPVDYDGVYSGAYYCSVFSNCTSLTSVDIGVSLQSLYAGTFADSSSLTSATFYNPGTEIGSYAIGYHKNASDKYVANTGVKITGYSGSTAETYAKENSLTFVSMDTFSKTGSAGTNVTWSLTNGVLTISGKGAMTDFDSYTSAPWYIYRGMIRSVVVESGVTSIGKYSFSNHYALTSVQLPASLTKISSYAFYKCTGLKTIDIPGTATVSEKAFMECTKLTTVLMSSGVKSIENYAFGVVTRVYDAKNGVVSGGSLADVAIPSTVTSIAENAFYGNTKAVVHYCDQTSYAYQYAVKYGMATSKHYWVTDTSGSTVCKYCGTKGYAVSPTAKSVAAGKSATFTVQDDGAGVSYQWQYRTPEDATWLTTKLPGYNTKTLTVSSAPGRNGYQYRCKVVDSNGNAIYSTAATLWVTQFTSQPKDAVVAAGTNAVFAVETTGNNLTYQWQFRTSSTSAWQTTRLTGYNTNKLTVAATSGRSGYIYRCKITDPAGNVVYSNGATLYVTAVTTQPADVSVALNKNAVFTVKAVGKDLTYRWQYQAASGGEWQATSLTGYKTNSLTVAGTPGRDGMKYRCKITDAAGNVVYSNPATLSVTRVLTQPVSAYVAAGKDAKFAVTASGKNLTYQWQFRTSATSAWQTTRLTGYNTNTLTVSGTVGRNGYQYRCQVKDGAGNAVYSSAATLTVTGFTTNPADASVVANKNAVFTVAAIGPDLTYQWQFRTSATSAWQTTRLTGYNTNTLTVTGTAGRDSYQYRCKITDSKGNEAYSKAAVLRVTAIKTQPKAVSVAVNKNAVFTVAATGKGLTYQWQYQSASGSTWLTTKLTGYNTASLTVAGTPGRDGMKYRCKITDADGNVIYSNGAQLSVTRILTHPESASVLTGENAVFTVSASGSGLKYQWQYQEAAGGTWRVTGLTGNKTDTLTVGGTPGRNGMKYRCRVTDASGNIVYSNAATLQVTSAES